MEPLKREDRVVCSHLQYRVNRRWLIGVAAVKPDEAARSLKDFITTFDMSKTGQFWSVRGTAGVPSAEAVLGKCSVTSEPIQLPW